VDYMESTGSYLGFRGTESLGGGLTAWFQCETTMDIRGMDQVGLCSRNSGLGLRGGFGNIWLGRWHTPFSRIYGMGNPGQEETGIIGTSGINGGSGSTSLAEGGTGSGGSTNRQRFRRRETCLSTYETPNFSGVQVGFAISCGNGASDARASSTANGTNLKPRLWSTALTYQQGPLGLGIAYQKHKEAGTHNAAPGTLEPDDRAWGASGRYAFGPLVLGMTYMDRKWETAVGGHTKNRTWTVAAEWTISGPHVLVAYYGATGDAKGNGPAIGNGGGGSTGATAVGSGTGYDVINLAYQYNFSKRTSVKVGWTRYDNDSNSSANRGFGTGGQNLLATGQSLDNYAVIMKHRF
jgi:predicted porin